jgi:DNA (cytosine-5)-methyltransferase 1
MKILNLYAGIGGNRKLWGNEHEVTAIEYIPAIADVYKEFYPNDTVIVADAHEYLLHHHKEFDFIWSSPPCPTHSKLQIPQNALGNVRYPDMKLYQEIILLKHFSRVPWVVENVVGYYTPLIPPTRELARHYFWTNFPLAKYYNEQGSYDLVRHGIASLQEYLGMELPPNTKEARKLLRNCVHPKLGEFVFNCKDSLKQEMMML